MVQGLEPTTFGMWVSCPNHYSRAPVLIGMNFFHKDLFGDHFQLYHFDTTFIELCH